MIKEALEYLSQQLAQAHKPEVVHEDRLGRCVLVNTGSAFETRTFEKLAPERKHRFATLEGFLSYLASGHASVDAGPVFVGEKAVVCSLTYGDPTQDVIRLDLADSEEWSALMQLGRGVDQKGLWRALVTKLADSVDPSLVLIIGTLSMTQKQGEAANIDPFGLATVKGAKETVVTFPAAGGAGEQRKTIANEWIFEVRRWECFQTTFKVLTTLELESDGKEIRFVFHPRRLKQVEQAARAALVAELTTTTDAARFTVHEGEL